MSTDFADHADTHREGDRAALVEAMSRAVQQVAIDAVVNADPTGPRVPLMVMRSTTPIAPARLASHLADPRAREQARTLYERCLARYREQAREQSSASRDDSDGAKQIHLDDAGAALARFVAANLEALQGLYATPPMLQRLGHQLTAVAYASSAWGTASRVDRQAYFEQMAILSVLIHEVSAQAACQGPAAIANVQRAAHGYLQQLLGFDPNRLTLGADGLALQPV